MQAVFQNLSLSYGNLLRQRWVVIALIISLTVITAQFALKVHHTELGSRSAFLRWRQHLDELDAGVNIWEKHAHPNPPPMVLILRPFWRLPPMLGASLWFACKAMLTVAAILMVLTLLEPECTSRKHEQLTPFPLWGQLLAVALALRPIEGDLVHGNTNLLVLFLIASALTAFANRRDGLAGGLIALGIACKFTPALFILYFLWKRAWSALLCTLAGVALFVFILPSLFYGWHNNLTYLRSWHEQMVAPYAAGMVTSEHKNQSLPGLLHRMLTEEPSFSDYAGDQRITLESHNFVSWNRDTVQTICLACMAFCGFLAMLFCRTSATARPRVQIIAEFSVVILGMLLFCERTWKHHGVTLLLPFAVLAYVVSTRHFSRGMRWYVGVTLAVVALLMLSTSTGVIDTDTAAHHRIGKLALVYGAYVWAFVLLLASMFAVLAVSPAAPYDSVGQAFQPDGQAGMPDQRS